MVRNLFRAFENEIKVVDYCSFSTMRPRHEIPVHDHHANVIALTSTRQIVDHQPKITERKLIVTESQVIS